MCDMIQTQVDFFFSTTLATPESSRVSNYFFFLFRYILSFFFCTLEFATSIFFVNDFISFYSFFSLIFLCVFRFMARTTTTTMTPLGQ